MLFSCSIRENISYGAVDPGAVTTEDIYNAARVANAYDFIQAFPKGFDTIVGEKGVLLSGEEQRNGIMITTPTSLLIQGYRCSSETNIWGSGKFPNSANCTSALKISFVNQSSVYTAHYTTHACF